MTLQEFHLYTLRVFERNKKRKEDQELTIEMTRSFMALFANANGAKDVTPDQFFKLSYDTKVDGEDLPREKQIISLEEMAYRFTPKNKRNGKK